MGKHEPLLDCSVGLDIDDISDSVLVSDHARSVEAVLVFRETYLYCLKYVDNLIMPFFLKSREKAYYSLLASARWAS